MTHYPPRDYREWTDYVAAVVSRYAGDIHHWEIWNEPDLTEFWNGTPEQYAQLLAVTYTTTKHIDPSATVVLGGQAFVDLPDHPAGEFSGRILGDAEHPAAADFDIAAFHYYLPPGAGAAPVRSVPVGAFGLRDRRPAHLGYRSGSANLGGNVQR